MEAIDIETDTISKIYISAKIQEYYRIQRAEDRTWFVYEPISTIGIRRKYVRNDRKSY